MPQRVNRYTRIAIILGISGVLIVATSATAYWLVLGAGGISSSSGDWGTFGDFMGGLPGTLIALATLLALALTLHLQAEELSRTSAALENQAIAAADQHRLTREIEMRRIRPLIKVEWMQRYEKREHHEVVELRVRNVGLGAAIVDRIEVANDNQTFALALDEVDTSSQWQRILRSALPESVNARIINFGIQALGDLNRALAPNEDQLLFRLAFQPDEEESILPFVEGSARLTIYFRSLAGQQLSTINQFDISPL